MCWIANGMIAVGSAIILIILTRILDLYAEEFSGWDVIIGLALIVFGSGLKTFFEKES